MAVTSFAAGTQAASIGTEHTLASVNVAGAFQGWVDMSNLAALDRVVLRVYRIVKTGGTTRVAAIAAFCGAQAAADLVKFTRAFTNPNTDTDALKFTLQQTHGTGRNFDYGVDRAN